MSPGWVGEARVNMPVDALEVGSADDRCRACADGIVAPFAFSMAFQPVIHLPSGATYAYEALVRGPAGESAASVLDRLTPATLYAFDQNCRRKAIELASRLGLVEQGARLNINFIPGAVYEPAHCIRATLAAARRTDFPLERITFEVTEGERVPDTTHLRAIFQEYRRHGFRTALDDFGAAYAGLNLLAEFQPDILKLDRELVMGIDTSAARRAIVAGLTGICRVLGIDIVAEGVETRAECATLRALGLELMQGYLFARPGFEALPPVALPG
jgi:EAL domain-containing protein (putative c-di-GMP-specific phosphodiesterase class I)